MTRPVPSGPQPGDRVIAFDGMAWWRAGRDCKCCPDNGCFRRPATVLRRYLKRSSYFGWVDDLVDLRWDDDGTESKAHFPTHMEIRP